MADVITEYVGLEGYIKQLLSPGLLLVKFALQINPSVDSHGRLVLMTFWFVPLEKSVKKLKVI